MSSRLLEIQTRIYNLLASWLPESDNSGAEPAAPAQTILENQNRMYDLLAARFAQMPDEIVDAVLQYLEDHPEAIDQAAVEAILDGRLDDIEEGLGGLKSAVNTLEDDAFKISAGSAVTADSSADGERWNYVNGDYIKGTTGTAQYWNNKKYTVQENTYYIVTGCYMTTAPMVIFVDANNNFIGNSGLITISENYVRDTITIKTPIGTASIIVQNFGTSDVYPNVKNGVVTSTFNDKLEEALGKEYVVLTTDGELGVGRSGGRDADNPGSRYYPGDYGCSQQAVHLRRGCNVGYNASCIRVH